MATNFKRCDRRILDDRHYAFGARNWIAMRVEFRLAEALGNAAFEKWTDVMFEALGFIMDFIPGVTQFADKIGLDQSVTANGRQCRSFSEWSQMNSSARMYF